MPFTETDLLHLLASGHDPEESRAASVKRLQQMGLLACIWSQDSKGPSFRIVRTDRGNDVVAEALAAAKERV